MNYDVTKLTTASPLNLNDVITKIQNGGDGHDARYHGNEGNGTDGSSPRDRWVSVLSLNYNLPTVILVGTVGSPSVECVFSVGFLFDSFRGQ